MEKIKSKKESMMLISRLGLNTLPVIMLDKYDERKVAEFVERYPSDTYCVRDTSKSASKLLKLFVKRENLVDYIKDARHFSINISGGIIAQHQLLTGEIQVSSGGDFILTATSDKNASARDGALNPQYVVDSRYQRVPKNIPGLDLLLDYIFIHQLFDTVVEFAVYDKKLGTENEHVCVFELRNEY